MDAWRGRLGRGDVGNRVGPRAQAGLNEALRLAVGAGRVWRRMCLHPALGQQLTERDGCDRRSRLSFMTRSTLRSCAAKKASARARRAQALSFFSTAAIGSPPARGVAARARKAQHDRVRPDAEWHRESRAFLLLPENRFYICGWQGGDTFGHKV